MKEDRVATQARTFPARPDPEPAQADDDGPEGPLGQRQLRVMLAEREAATARFRALKLRLLRRR